MRKVISSQEELVNLFDEKYTLFISRAFRFTNNFVLAEDLLQDVFIEILERVDLESIDNLVAFILSLIKRRGIDFTRKRKIPLLEFDETLKQNTLHDNIYLPKQEILKILNILAKKAKLDELQMQYFNLIKSGLSNKDIADELNVSADYVRVVKQTIMRKLRKAKSDIECRRY